MAMTQAFGAGRTLIMDGSFSAAAIHCLTALGLSATGKSHHVSHAGVSGFARNDGTYESVSSISKNLQHADTHGMPCCSGDRGTCKLNQARWPGCECDRKWLSQPSCQSTSSMRMSGV